MPDIQIVKLKVRRGTDSQRRKVILEQGELGYTTDTERLFVGDGVLSGGNIAGSFIHEVQTSPGSRTSLNAYTSDLVYESNLMYQLTGVEAAALSAWGFVGSQVDDSSVGYDGNNKLHVKAGGILHSMLSAGSVEYDTLNSNVVHVSGGINLNDITGLSANVDNSTIYIDSNNNLSVPAGGITSVQIASGGVDVTNISASVVGPGLSGGGGDVLAARVDNVTLQINITDEIEVKTIQASNINLGPGFTGSATTLEAEFQTADTDDFILTAGELSLVDKLTYDNQGYNLPALTISKEGIIVGAFTGTLIPLSTNATGMGGFAPQLSGFETNTLVSVVTAENTVAQVLSSAGFMVIRTGTPAVTTGDSRDFEKAQYLAVPVFTLPPALITLIDYELL
jgi:hypothetical protein